MTSRTRVLASVAVLPDNMVAGNVHTHSLPWAMGGLVLLRPNWSAAVSISCLCFLLAVLLFDPAHLRHGFSPSAGACGRPATLDQQGRADSRGEAGAGGSSSSGGSNASCRLPVAASAWTNSCELLADACVDQGAIILYGEKHRMSENNPGLAPYQINPARGQAKFILFHRNSYAHDKRYVNPPIRVRPESAMEGTAYLANPVFSSCTVPVVWYPLWLGNAAHVFRDSAAKILGFLENTTWAEHVKLVLVTGEGTGTHPFSAITMQPLLKLQMETWADFSNRLPARQVEGGYVPVDAWPQGADGYDTSLQQPLSLPWSYEGGPQRCFRHILVCNRGSSSNELPSWPLHGLGKRLVQHHRREWEAVAQGVQQTAGGKAGEAGEAGAGAADAQPSQRHQLQQEQHAGLMATPAARKAAAATTLGAGDASSQDGSSQDGVLRVVFHKRSSPDRQLLNAAELIRRCNGWQYTSTDGRRLRASCWEVELTDLFTGMAAAQQADVFVGVHGANMVNAWFLRPGSSMIELQPYGFDAGPAHLQYPAYNMEDGNTSVLWWLLSVCDPADSTPGSMESKGYGGATGWAKDRNLRIRWETLEVALRTALDLNGDMEQYRQRWEQGRWWWFVGRGGNMTFAGRQGKPFTRVRCPQLNST